MTDSPSPPEHREYADRPALPSLDSSSTLRDSPQPIPFFNSPDLKSHLSFAHTHPAHIHPAYAAVLLSCTDRLRSIGFPDDVLVAVNTVIQQLWAPGVQEQKAFDETSWEWKLSSRPWSGWGLEGVCARRLLTHIFHALLGKGWKLSLSTRLSHKTFEMDTLIFHTCLPAQRYIFPISFNDSDKIRLIDAPDEHIKYALHEAVSGSWPKGVQAISEKHAGSFQLKLKGRPWSTSDEHDVVASRILAFAILSAMDKEGYELLSRVNMTMGSGEENGDLDTWFFISKE